MRTPTRLVYCYLILDHLRASTFRTPARTAFNDTKRKAWFDDLANPDVPLAKLGKSIPHSARNHELLDLLYENNVAIPRAVWFIRAFGSNETVGIYPLLKALC